MSARTRGDVIKEICAAGCECIFCLKELEITYMCDYSQGPEGILHEFNKHCVKHELKSVLSWVRLSVPRKGGIHSCCATGGTQLRGDSFGVSHIRRNMGIDLGH